MKYNVDHDVLDYMEEINSGFLEVYNTLPDISATDPHPIRTISRYIDDVYPSDIDYLAPTMYPCEYLPHILIKNIKTHKVTKITPYGRNFVLLRERLSMSWDEQAEYGYWYKSAHDPRPWPKFVKENVE